MSITPQRLGRIAFCLDERLSREKNAILTRKINALRRFAEIDLISGETPEDQLLQKLEAQNYQLVFAPWDRYLAWARVEAFYGLMRTSGPTFAGYYCEPLYPAILGDPSGQYRVIMLDFNALNIQELCTLVRALIQDHSRTGMRPLLEPGTQIFCESWFSSQGLGHRLDALMTLPGIGNTNWAKRSSAIRITLCALWSLIYEEGPGKGELSQVITGATPKAYFQVAADATALVFRLCYALPSLSPKDALRMFWPDVKKPTAAAQLLSRHCDFLRVHTIPEAADIEIIAAFFPSSAAENSVESVQTLWIEPISVKLVTEVPFETPSPNSPHLKPLLVPQIGSFKPQPVQEAAEKKDDERRERFVFQAAAKVRELKRLLAEKDDLIRDLRCGGIGSTQPMPPPDAEGLLDAFQERYFEARFQIRQFELQITDMETKGATPQEIEGLRLKMNALAEREQTWIKKLVKTLEIYRDAKKKA